VPLSKYLRSIGAKTVAWRRRANSGTFFCVNIQPRLTSDGYLQYEKAEMIKQYAYVMQAVICLAMISSVSAELIRPEVHFKTTMSHIEGSDDGRFALEHGHLFFNIRSPRVSNQVRVFGSSNEGVNKGVSREVSSLIAASAESLGATSPADIKLVETRESQFARHHRFTLIHKGLPIRGTDYRVHVASDGTVSSFNGQRPDNFDLLKLYTARFFDDAELAASLIQQDAALELAKTALKGHAFNRKVDGFQVLRSSLELSVVAPHARYTFDLSQPRGMQRFVVELDAVSGEVIQVHDRIRAHARALQRGSLR